VCIRWPVALAVSVAAAGCPVRAGAIAPVAAVEARAAQPNQAAWQAFLLDDLSQPFSRKEDWPRAVAADREASAHLSAIAEDVRQGRLEDMYQGCTPRWPQSPPGSTGTSGRGDG